MFASIAFSFLLSICWQPAANAAAVSGDSTTVLRLRQTSQDKNLLPLYEYLHLSVVDPEKNGSLSFHFGGWARGDLADKSSDDRGNGDVQYGYLSYRAKKNNFQLNAGRQFVVEGVGSEKLDGLYLRSDLAAGFTAAAFIGAPVVTEPNFEGGDLIFGGRLAHGRANYYSLGISALRTDDHLREEEGLDLWLHPTRQIDVAGRSSFNSITGGWMEHAYTASFTPTDALTLGATLSQVNYRDYFHHVTTSALSLTNGILDPNEEVLSVGASVGLAASKSIGVAADYRHFEYEIAGSADYFGGKASFSLPDALSAGLSFHRMNGSGVRLKYNEFRAYASKKLGRLDLTLDFFDILYDGSINGRKNTYSLAAAAGYDLAQRLRVAADIDFLRSSDFDLELRGLIKLIYAFDFERRGKK
jgi:hypothetical protein